MYLEKIRRLAKSNPDKCALIDNYTQLSYVSFCKKIEELCQYYISIFNQTAGIVVIQQRALSDKWCSILALRSLGFTTISISDIDIIKSIRLENIQGYVYDTLSIEDYEILRSIYPNMLLKQLTNNFDFSKVPQHSNEIFSNNFGDHIEYTSGSTGQNKALVRRGILFEELVERTTKEFDIAFDTVFYMGGVHPGTGVGSKVPLTCWSKGATVVFNQKPDFVMGVEKIEFNRTFITPVMMRHLLNSTYRENFKKRKLRMYVGGGFLDPILVEQAKKILGCEIYLNYAATECGIRMQNKINQPEDCVWLSPLSDGEVQIVDKNLNITQVGVVGSVRVGLQLCDPCGYLNDPVATAQFFSKGFFYTGDLAIQREDGRIKILGREKNVINIGGNKKPIEQVEINAMRDLNVNNLCLFSLQNKNGDVILKVVIEDDKLPNQDNLKKFILAIGFSFSSIEFHYIKNFPYQVLGIPKIDRTAILNSLSRSTLLQKFSITH